MKSLKAKDESRYGYYLGRSLRAFLILYVLTMIFFTCIQAKYHSDLIDKEVAMNNEMITECIERTNKIKLLGEENLQKDKIEMWRSGRINKVSAAYWLFTNKGEHPENEAQVAIYDEAHKEWIAKTGNCLIFKADKHLEVPESLWGQFEEKDFEIYATLYIEHYLSKEQIDLMLKDERYGKETFSVEGYYNEGEIIPQKLQQYELTYDPSDTRKLLSRKLIHTLTFDVPADVSGMTPFVGQSDHFFSRKMCTSSYYDNNYNKLKGEWNWEAYNRALIPDIEEIIQDGETTLSNEKSLLKIRLRQLEKINVGENTYWISSYIVAFPLYEAAIVSTRVYLMGGLAAVVLAVICSVVLWRRKLYD